MTDNIPTIHKAGDLLLYRMEDGFTRVGVNLKRSQKKLEQIESKISNAKLLKKKKEDI